MAKGVEREREREGGRSQVSSLFEKNVLHSHRVICQKDFLTDFYTPSKRRSIFFVDRLLRSRNRHSTFQFLLPNHNPEITPEGEDDQVQKEGRSTHLNKRMRDRIQTSRNSLHPRVFTNMTNVLANVPTPKAKTPQQQTQRDRYGYTPWLRALLFRFCLQPVQPPSENV